MVEQVQSLSNISIAPAFHDAEGREVRIRYAPEGAEVSNVYFTNGYARPLALGQLVAAVMLKAAAAYEARAVYKLNVLNGGTSSQKMQSFVDELVCNTLLKKLEAALDKGAGKPEMDLQETDLAKQIKDFNYHPKTDAFKTTPNAWVFLTSECGIANVQQTISGYDAFMDLHEKLRPVMEESTRSSAITQAELQSAISRRDVSYTTSANIVKSIVGSLSGTAGALRI